MKKYKIMFWTSTIIIFLMEGVLPALTWNSEMSRQGILGLGYPAYFIPMLTIFKVIGALVLVIPAVPGKVKEWAYAGFAIDFICALFSIIAVTGISVMIVLPIVFFALLVLSYVSRHKIISESTAVKPA
jgi:hypothetical protein